MPRKRASIKISYCTPQRQPQAGLPSCANVYSTQEGIGMKKQVLQLSATADLASYFLNSWDAKTIDKQEKVYLILLDAEYKLLHFECIGQGTHNSCNLDINYILRTAVLQNATYVTIAHNHPNSGVKPSQADIAATQKLYFSLQVLGIVFLDHIIVNNRSDWNSMVNEGFFGAYAHDFEAAKNTATTGTFEHTVINMTRSAFERIQRGGLRDNALNQLNQGLEKCYIKYFDPII